MRATTVEALMPTRLLLPILLLLGCGDNGALPPTAPAFQPPPPPPPPPATGAAYVWGHVVKDSGACIPGAVVEIIAGPGTGRKDTQEGPCDAWSYAVGYEFHDLPLGATVRLRATAKGYRPQERELVTRNGGYPFQFELELE
jgi:hypothetical protein